MFEKSLGLSRVFRDKNDFISSFENEFFFSEFNKYIIIIIISNMYFFFL